MKQTIAAIVVLAALAAATGQDTVKLPDPDFWVTRVDWPSRGSRHIAWVDWQTGRASKAWLKQAAVQTTWEVLFVIPGMGTSYTAYVERQRPGFPTREEVRHAVRLHMLKKSLKPTRAPKELQHLVGRYRRSELRPRSPSTTTRPSSTGRTAP